MPDPSHLLAVGGEFVLVALTITLLRRSQRGRREPWRYLIGVFLGGAAAAVLIGVVQVKLFDLSPTLDVDSATWQSLWLVITEELAKYLVAVIAITNSRHLYRLSSAITYLILVGLGFALMEDILYLLVPDSQPLPRLLSFLVHAGTSSVIGYALGRYRFGLAGYRYLSGAFILAVLLHWSFNLGVTLLDRQSATLITAAINLFVSSRIIILYRRTLLEEYKLERELLGDEEPVKLMNHHSQSPITAKPHRRWFMPGE
jgi:RsiW-degrading membrane proteinase PrsW (M82 family)